MKRDENKVTAIWGGPCIRALLLQQVSGSCSKNPLGGCLIQNWTTATRQTLHVLVQDSGTGIHTGQM